MQIICLLKGDKPLYFSSKCTDRKVYLFKTIFCAYG